MINIKCILDSCKSGKKSPRHLHKKRKYCSISQKNVDHLQHYGDNELTPILPLNDNVLLNLSQYKDEYKFKSSEEEESDVKYDWSRRRWRAQKIWTTLHPSHVLIIKQILLTLPN